MRKLLIVLIVIFASCNEYSKVKKIDSDSANINDKDIYELVNLILEEKDWAVKNIDGLKYSPWKYLVDNDSDPLFNSIDSTKLLKDNSIFSKADLKFIEKQIHDNRNFKYKKEFILTKKIISSETIDSINIQRMKQGKGFYEIYEQKYGKEFCVWISVPVFSIDKKTAFVTISGSGCGTESVIYKKDNNRWKYWRQTSVSAH